MRDFIDRLVNDFNTYSELVALNYAKMAEGEKIEDILEWNRGNLNRIEEYLRDLAEANHIELVWTFEEHNFGCDDWARVLKYRTVSIER